MASLRPPSPSARGLEFLGAVAGGLVHEIRNPLSTLRLNLQLMEEDFEGDDGARARRALERIHTLEREVSRLEDILDDFLRYAGFRRLDAAEVDLNRVIEETTTFFAPECARAGVDLAFYPDLRLPLVRLDERLVKQALMNLLLNAVQAMDGRAGSQLFVRTRLEGDRARVDVIDNGPGIPAELRERVWDVYFSSKKAGTGLGLPTARRIAEEHGGTLGFETEVGKGTDFFLVLPLRGPAVAPADAAPAGA
ncbi:MAG: two-component sensor histidine kinase [Planctomycetes bacterium]|nr:two-component sensor histidine kinase [Planctomycetota bacterium]